MDNKETKSENTKAGTKVLSVVIAICAAAVVVSIVFAKLYQNQSETEGQEIIGVEANVVTNEDEAVASSGSPGSFTTYYQRDIYVTNGHEATGLIGNDASNPYEDMYIQIFLNNEETDELGDEIYLSQIIPRGNHVEEFELEKDLDVGNYRATLVHAILNEDGELVNNVSVIVEIHVS